MIKGIGTDIVDIHRIDDVIAKYGNHFLRKVFTEAEIRLCNGKVNPASHFAGRWAAKEAFFKAMPLSCQAVSSWKSIQIVSAQENTRPIIDLCCDRLKECLAAENISFLHLSISHEQAFCIAIVVAE